jgi:hypothetical protein
MKALLNISRMLFIAYNLGVCYYVVAYSSDDDSRNGSSKDLPPLGEGALKLLWLTPVLVQPLPEPPDFAAGLASRAAALFEAFQANATRGQGTAGVALRQVVQGSESGISESRSGSAGSSSSQGRLEPHHMNDAFYAWQVALPSRSWCSSIHQRKSTLVLVRP